MLTVMVLRVIFVCLFVYYCAVGQEELSVDFCLFPCGPTETSSGNCQKMETGMIQVSQRPHPLEKKTPKTSGNLGG